MIPKAKGGVFHKKEARARSNREKGGASLPSETRDRHDRAPAKGRFLLFAAPEIIRWGACPSTGIFLPKGKKIDVHTFSFDSGIVPLQRSTRTDPETKKDGNEHFILCGYQTPLQPARRAARRCGALGHLVPHLRRVRLCRRRHHDRRHQPRLPGRRFLLHALGLCHLLRLRRPLGQRSYGRQLLPPTPHTPPSDGSLRGPCWAP